MHGVAPRAHVHARERLCALAAAADGVKRDPALVRAHRGRICISRATRRGSTQCPCRSGTAASFDTFETTKNAPTAVNPTGPALAMSRYASIGGRRVVWRRCHLGYVTCQTFENAYRMLGVAGSLWLAASLAAACSRCGLSCCCCSCSRLEYSEVRCLRCARSRVCVICIVVGVATPCGLDVRGAPVLVWPRAAGWMCVVRRCWSAACASLPRAASDHIVLLRVLRVCRIRCSGLRCWLRSASPRRLHQRGTMPTLIPLQRAPHLRSSSLL